MHGMIEKWLSILLDKTLLSILMLCVKLFHVVPMVIYIVDPADLQVTVTGRAMFTVEIRLQPIETPLMTAHLQKLQVTLWEVTQKI